MAIPKEENDKRACYRTEYNISNYEEYEIDFLFTYFNNTDLVQNYLNMILKSSDTIWYFLVKALIIVWVSDPVLHIKNHLSLYK